MQSRARAELLSDALLANLRALSAHAGARVLLPVKANGYGHGLAQVVRATRDAACVWGYGVATPQEALEAAREAGGKVVLLMTPATPDEAAELAAAGVRLTVSDAGQLAGLPRGARVHVKVNTGMNRLGVLPLEAARVATTVAETCTLEGVFTHFASADEPDLAFAREQLARFGGVVRAVKAAVPGVVAHASNSGGVLSFGRDAAFDLIRPGMASYGFPPPHLAGIVPLFPALRVTARVLQVHEVQPGESVSYSALWTAERATRVAVVAFGYADGYPRGATLRAHVVVRGERRGVLGRICMDQCMVDVTGTNVRAGDWVELYGTGPVTAADVAEWGGTIPYEVYVRLGPRVERVVATDAAATAEERRA